MFEKISLYYANGNIKSEIPYVDGKRNGTVINYYQNGNVNSKIDYCDGKINGYVRTYFENGDLESQETYTNGERNNDLICYSSDGDITYSSNNEYYNDYVFAMNTEDIYKKWMELIEMKVDGILDYSIELKSGERVFIFADHKSWEYCNEICDAIIRFFVK